MNILAAYNVHKRSTLDRISGKYHLTARRFIKAAIQAELPAIEAAIERGSEVFEPDTENLEKSLNRVFLFHGREAVKVAISDGIREVSPDEKLSTWLQYPLTMPIELTLGTELASEREKMIQKFLDRRSGLVKQVQQFVTNVTDDYRRNLRAAYTRAAHDWIAGGEDESGELVRARMKEALQKTDSGVERIFRTETTAYFNESRHEYFKDNTSVDYVQLYAVTDGRISKICDTRHGFVVSLEKAGLKLYLPPFHPNCRTIQRPLISSLSSHKSIIEKGLEIDERSFAPLPGGWG